MTDFTPTHLLWVAATTTWHPGSSLPPVALDAAFALTTVDLVDVHSMRVHIDPALSPQVGLDIDPQALQHWPAIPMGQERRNQLVNSGFRDEWVAARHAGPRYVDFMVQSLLTNAGLGGPEADAVMLAGPNLTRDLPAIAVLLETVAYRIHQDDILDTAKLTPAWRCWGPMAALPGPDQGSAPDRVDAAIEWARQWHHVLGAATYSTIPAGYTTTPPAEVLAPDATVTLADDAPVTNEDGERIGTVTSAELDGDGNLRVTGEVDGDVWADAVGPVSAVSYGEPLSDGETEDDRVAWAQAEQWTATDRALASSPDPASLPPLAAAGPAPADDEESPS